MSPVKKVEEETIKLSGTKFGFGFLKWLIPAVFFGGSLGVANNFVSFSNQYADYDALSKRLRHASISRMRPYHHRDIPQVLKVQPCSYRSRQ